MIHYQGKSKQSFPSYVVGFLATFVVTVSLNAQSQPSGDFAARNSVVGQSNFLRYQQPLPAHQYQRQQAVKQAIARLNAENMDSSGSPGQVQRMVQPASFEQSIEPGSVSSADPNLQNGSSLTQSEQPKKESLIGFINQVLPSSQNRLRTKTRFGQEPNPQLAANQKLSPTEQAALFAMRSGIENPPADSASTRFGQAGPTLDPGKESEKIDLNAILKRIGISTAVVLAGCVIFLLIAKKFGFGIGPTGSIGNQSTSNTRINVIETKRLSSRCQLKLVEIDGSHFVVAEDNGGVKSVQPINKAFSASLEEYDQREEKKSSGAEDLTSAQASQLASLISRL